VAAPVLLAAIVPAVASAYWPAEIGLYTVECEEVLSEDFEGEKPDPESEVDVAEMHQCEDEAKAFAEHPTDFDPAPNMEAFLAGTEIVIFAVLFTIASFVVLNWIVKTMRSSQ
jgi:hypothetical protein